MFVVVVAVVVVVLTHSCTNSYRATAQACVCAGTRACVCASSSIRVRSLVRFLLQLHFFFYALVLV